MAHANTPLLQDVMEILTVLMAVMKWLAHVSLLHLGRMLPILLALSAHVFKGYGSCPVCLCVSVCPPELICRLALVDVEAKALAA